MPRGSAFATRIDILHVTSYRYTGNVHLGPHRLMLQPREGSGVHLVSLEILTNPPANLRWTEDVFGNSIVIAEFHSVAEKLIITARMDIELRDGSEQSRTRYVGFPISYSDQERDALGVLTCQRYPDPDGKVKRWAAAFIYSIPTEAFALLGDLCLGVSTSVSYRSRDDFGTQSPQHTLERGWGACRDLAVLFAEAARSLGFGARIVSGYLFDPSGQSSGAGATHAWAEVYLPQTGWIAFDPTHAAASGTRLIPIAVGADITDLPPVSGDLSGDGAAMSEMRVEVSVSQRPVVID